MKKNVNRICLFLLAIVLLSTLNSCTPKESETVKAEAVGGNVRLDDETKGEQSAGEKTIDEVSVLSVIGEPEGKDFLLFKAAHHKPVFPEDFEIGPLQPQIEMLMDENELLIYNLAVDFAVSIVGNDPDSRFIYDDRREFVTRNLSDMLYNLSLTDYRLGIINTDSEPAMADIRFVGEDGFIEGTMYFIREDSWKIYDLQLMVSDNNDIEKVNNEKWFPLYNKDKF